MGAALPLVLSLLGACVQEAVDTEPCPDLGDGGFEVVEGEVENVEGYVCVDEERFDGVTADIVAPDEWAGHVNFEGGFPSSGLGTTYACTRDAFRAAWLYIAASEIDIEVELWGGSLELARDGDGLECGDLEMAAVVLRSSEIGSTLRLSSAGGPISCASSCSLD